MDTGVKQVFEKLNRVDEAVTAESFKQEFIRLFQKYGPSDLELNPDLWVDEDTTTGDLAGILILDPDEQEFMEDASGPVVTGLTVNPNKFEDAFSSEAETYVALHELAHAIQFPSYRDHGSGFYWTLMDLIFDEYTKDEVSDHNIIKLFAQDIKSTDGPQSLVGTMVDRTR